MKHWTGRQKMAQTTTVGSGTEVPLSLSHTHTHTSCPNTGAVSIHSCTFMSPKETLHFTHDSEALNTPSPLPLLVSCMLPSSVSTYMSLLVCSLQKTTMETRTLSHLLRWRKGGEGILVRRKLWIRLERTGRRQALQRDRKERRKWTTRCGFILMTSWSCLGMQYVATYVHKYIRTHMYVRM